MERCKCLATFLGEPIGSLRTTNLHSLRAQFIPCDVAKLISIRKRTIIVFTTDQPRFMADSHADANSFAAKIFSYDSRICCQFHVFIQSEDVQVKVWWRKVNPQMGVDQRAKDRRTRTRRTRTMRTLRRRRHVSTFLFGISLHLYDFYISCCIVRLS